MNTYSNRWTVEPLAPSMSQIRTRFDAKSSALWCYMRDDGPPIFSRQLLTDFATLQSYISNANAHSSQKLDFQIISSDHSGVFNLGGDLELFAELIEKRDIGGLRSYALSCVDLVYSAATGYGGKVRTVSLVTGSAFGGGFEAVLASNFVVAERSSKFGFPELLFNMFPGMGALQFLMRRVPRAVASRIIESARTYSAQEMFELGIVDILVDDGEGTSAVQSLLDQQSRRTHGRRALMSACDIANPVSLSELKKVANLWVQCALSLEETDLRTMRRLSNGAGRINSNSTSEKAVA